MAQVISGNAPLIVYVPLANTMEFRVLNPAENNCLYRQLLPSPITDVQLIETSNPEILRLVIASSRQIRIYDLQSYQLLLTIPVVPNQITPSLYISFHGSEAIWQRSKALTTRGMSVRRHSVKGSTEDPTCSIDTCSNSPFLPSSHRICEQCVHRPAPEQRSTHMASVDGTKDSDQNGHVLLWCETRSGRLSCIDLVSLRILIRHERVYEDVTEGAEGHRVLSVDRSSFWTDCGSQAGSDEEDCSTNGAVNGAFGFEDEVEVAARAFPTGSEKGLISSLDFDERRQYLLAVPIEPDMPCRIFRVDLETMQLRYIGYTIPEESRRAGTLTWSHRIARCVIQNQNEDNNLQVTQSSAICTQEASDGKDWIRVAVSIIGDRRSVANFVHQICSVDGVCRLHEKLGPETPKSVALDDQEVIILPEAQALHLGSSLIKVRLSLVVAASSDYLLGGILAKSCLLALHRVLDDRLARRGTACRSGIARCPIIVLPHMSSSTSPQGKAVGHCGAIEEGGCQERVDRPESLFPVSFLRPVPFASETLSHAKGSPPSSFALGVLVLLC